MRHDYPQNAAISQSLKSPDLVRPCILGHAGAAYSCEPALVLISQIANTRVSLNYLISVKCPRLKCPQSASPQSVSHPFTLKISVVTSTWSVSRLVKCRISWNTLIFNIKRRRDTVFSSFRRTRETPAESSPRYYQTNLAVVRRKCLRQSYSDSCLMHVGDLNAQSNWRDEARHSQTKFLVRRPVQSHEWVRSSTEASRICKWKGATAKTRQQTKDRRVRQFWN